MQENQSFDHCLPKFISKIALSGHADTRVGAKINGLVFFFTDKSKFEIDSSHRRVLCYRKKGERFQRDKIVQVKNRGYGSVVVWGGILGAKKTPLKRVNGRRRLCL